jgi:hypothetical protein
MIIEGKLKRKEPLLIKTIDKSRRCDVLSFLRFKLWLIFSDHALSESKREKLVQDKRNLEALSLPSVLIRREI